MDLMIERAFLSRTMPTMMSRAWAPVPGPMDFGAARFEFGREFDEMLVEVIDGFPLRFGGGLPRGRPVLERRLAFVAGDFVIAQCRANELAMAQIARHALRLFLELCGKGAHAKKVLTTDEHGWTRIRWRVARTFLSAGSRDIPVP